MIWVYTVKDGQLYTNAPIDSMRKVEKLTKITRKTVNKYLDSGQIS